MKTVILMSLLLVIILVSYFAIKGKLLFTADQGPKALQVISVTAQPAFIIVNRSQPQSLQSSGNTYSKKLVPTHKMLKHFKLWESFQKKMGRQKAAQYIPESYSIHNTASAEFADLLDSERIRDANQFILKGEGSSLVEPYIARQGLEDVLDSIKCNKLTARTFAPTAWTQSQLDLQKYTIVQKLIPDPMILGRRVFKIQVYLLLKHKSRVTSGFLHKNGLVYWARSRYNNENQTIDTLLASRANMYRGRSPDTIRQIYSGYPRTLQELSEQLTIQGLGQAVEHNLINALQALCYVLQDQASHFYGLYAVDVALNKIGEAFLLKVKRCQKNQDINDFDDSVLSQVWKDAVQDPFGRDPPAFSKIWPQTGWQA